MSEATSFDVLTVKIGAYVLAVGRRKNSPPPKKNESRNAHFRIFGRAKGIFNRDKFLHMGRGPRANFSDYIGSAFSGWSQFSTDLRCCMALPRMPVCDFQVES